MHISAYSGTAKSRTHLTFNIGSFVTCIMLNSRAVAKFGLFCNTITFRVRFTFASFANADSVATKSHNVGVFSGRCG